MCDYRETDLVAQLDTPAKHLLRQIQQAVKGTYLSCQDHMLFFRIPMISGLNFNPSIDVQVLRKAMDVLVSVP